MTPRRPIRGRLWRPAHASSPAVEEMTEIDPAEPSGQLVQPIADGAALDLHPLAVLIATITVQSP